MAAAAEAEEARRMALGEGHRKKKMFSLTIVNPRSFRLFPQGEGRGQVTPLTEKHEVLGLTNASPQVDKHIVRSAF